MAANHHLRLALDQVSDAVIIVENEPLVKPGPRVLFANEAMAEATGVPVQKLWDLPLCALSDGDMLLQLLTALSESAGDAAEASAPLNHLNGKPTPCRWSARRVTSGNGQTLNFILTASPDLAAAGLLTGNTGAVPLPPAPAETPAPAPAPAPAAVKPPAAEENKAPADAPPPAPNEYQQDLVETIRDTARYVAHEFNNALTAILLPVQLAIRQVPDGGELHSNLQDAFESARKAADLAKDFLDCFRPRAPKRERCRLGSLLGRALRLATCAQNVQWSLEVPDELMDVEADSNQIERVIFNLVRNACQAMPNGGKLLVKATNTAVSAAEGHTLTPGNYVHISVRDWGPGIPEEHIPHLFHSCFTTKKDGNGCGLPICYQIVRDHGGDMYVKTRDKVGTAFLLFLPAIAPVAETEPSLPVPLTFARPATAPVPEAAPVPAAPAPRPQTAAVAVPVPAPPEPVADMPPPLVPMTAVSIPAATAPPAPMPASAPVPAPAPVPATAPVAAPPETPEELPPALLVVDDEAKILIAFSKIGKFRGFDVTTAATSEEGLQYFRDRLLGNHPYDSVVVDINLRGGMNGMEVFDAIRRINAEVPIIATSGQCSEEELERYAEMGFAGFLPKPFTIEQFDEVMEEVLAPA